MTTEAAERQYLNEHLRMHDGRKLAVFNPLNKELEDLPVIYGFNNGGSSGWYRAVLISQDGTELGGHTCSHEGYMLADLGCLEGARPDRHETFAAHYPNGYRMEFVSYEDVPKHEALNNAINIAMGKQ